MTHDLELVSSGGTFEETISRIVVKTLNSTHLNISHTLIDCNIFQQQELIINKY